MSDALKALLEKHGKRLRVLIELHCGCDQGLDPDDIEQEVRIKLWKALESDKNLIAAASYIQKVVVTTVVDAVRRAQAIAGTTDVQSHDRQYRKPGAGVAQGMSGGYAARVAVVTVLSNYLTAYGQIVPFRLV